TNVCYYFCSLNIPAAIGESNPARHQLLYCRVGIGFHLQIVMNGSVWGIHEPSEYSLLRVFAVRPGIVGICGVKSERYLCMNPEGIAHGMKKFSNECLFKENMEDNHYNTYASLSTGFFLALSQQGQLRKGKKVGRHQACTHFLPQPSLGGCSWCGRTGPRVSKGWPFFQLLHAVSTFRHETFSGCCKLFPLRRGKRCMQK
uniref:Fibroblast growth factor n=1 Tax=Cyprinus carpio TaxID=7962 RepID=A0A8C2PS93_CYPCA